MFFKAVLLKQAFGSLNPSDPAAHDAVLVGHSMGGIISRLLEIARSKLLIECICNRSVTIGCFLKRFCWRIVINSKAWFTLAARKIIRLPGAFLSAVATSLTTENLDVKDN
jgi:pimeloyl-ACP methyl ester carboxylesterase